MSGFLTENCVKPISWFQTRPNAGISPADNEKGISLDDQSWRSRPFQIGDLALGSLVKNANIFIDVDLTLVDARGLLLDDARPALARLRDAGCHLFLWSSVGAEYARTVAQRHGLSEYFEGFAAKPDIIIDDMPGTARAPFSYGVDAPYGWEQLADHIITKHVDRT